MLHGAENIFFLNAQTIYPLGDNDLLEVHTLKANFGIYRDTDASVGAGGDATEQESAAPVQEEPRELTLDEYKALKGNRQKPTYNLRKAGEGEDLTQWKKMYALKKKEGEEDEEEEEVCRTVEMFCIGSDSLGFDTL